MVALSTGWLVALTLAMISYSGATAAHAYHHVSGLERVKRVFILGPSHHFYLR